MKAIETRLDVETHTITARANGCTVVRPCDYERSIGAQHRDAAHAVCDKMGWCRPLESSRQLISIHQEVFFCQETPKPWTQPNAGRT